MSLVRMVGFCACLAVFVAGCRTSASCQRGCDCSHQAASTPSTGLQAAFPTPTVLAQPSSIQSLQQQTLAVAPSPSTTVFPSAISQVGYQQQSSGSPLNAAELLPQVPAQVEFCLQEFVSEVQARNPSLQAMFAAAHAAAEKYPQVVALDDPMFNANLAPASLGSSQVEGAYTVELSQKYPWFGKRAARGRSAKADAGSAYSDAQTTRLQLIETAEQAFFDYYLVARQRELSPLGHRCDAAIPRYGREQISR